MKKQTLLVLLVTVFSLASCHSDGLLLQTKVAQGDIEGVMVDGYALYHAIPYAEAPVGDLRWKAPVPKAPWEGVYKDTTWGDRPWQPFDPGQNQTLPMSEDCLYLSVATPATSKRDKLPVFVMIHGGGFSTGSYSGLQSNFVEEGIIYCSIEYRLGAFGFMPHPELEKESEQGISGNYGILDQICALRWIHDNIRAFGGDPNRITICGESAGGISVSMLCASPLCKGLFNGAISESGGNFCPITDAPSGLSSSMKSCHTAAAAGLAFQQMLGCNSIEEMRALPAETIQMNPASGQFWPVLDEYAIVGDQYVLYQNGQYNDVPCLIGYNSDEGSLFIREMNMDGYNGMIYGMFANAVEDVKKAYPATNDQEALWAIQDIFRDNAFGYSTWAWANLQSRTGKSPVYFYYFDQASDNSFVKNGRGATHVAEMPFIYDWHWGEMTETETEMGNTMRRYWINFIKNGNPNAKDLPEWKNYTEADPMVMRMHEGFSLITTPNLDQMNFFENYFAPLRK